VKLRSESNVNKLFKFLAFYDLPYLHL